MVFLIAALSMSAQRYKTARIYKTKSFRDKTGI